MATDKRLDQVSTLTDFDYALIVKGGQVAKASKQQLAELVGNLLYGATNASSLATVVAGLNGFGFSERKQVTVKGSNDVAYFLLGKKGEKSKGTYIQVYSVPYTGFNDIPVAFIAYYSTSYNSREISSVTSLTGNSYTIEDVEYEGVTYRAIPVSTGASSNQSLFHIYGSSYLGLDNILVRK